MKTKITLLILSFAIFSGLYSDENPDGAAVKDGTKTLFRDSTITFSGYGAPVLKFSKIGDSFAVLGGLKGGVLVNDNFCFGLAGNFLVNPDSRDDVSGKNYIGDYDNINFGYGGFLAEYYFSPKSLFGLSAGVTVGGGRLDFSDRESNKCGGRRHKSNRYERGSAFFAVEPELSGFVNITKFCRAGVSLSYRFVSGIDAAEFTDKDFRGPSVGIVMAFGWF